MSKLMICFKHLLTRSCKSVTTVQAGTPMTVTGNGALLSDCEQGVPIFCLKISLVAYWFRHWFEEPMSWGQSPGIGRRDGAGL